MADYVSIIHHAFYSHLKINTIQELFDIEDNDIDVEKEMQTLDNIGFDSIINLCDLYMDIDNTCRFQHVVDSNISLIFDIHVILKEIAPINKYNEKISKIMKKYIEKIKSYNNDMFDKLCEKQSLEFILNVLNNYNIDTVNEFLLTKIVNFRIDEFEQHDNFKTMILNVLDCINVSEYENAIKIARDYKYCDKVKFYNKIFLLINKTEIYKSIELLNKKVIQLIEDRLNLDFNNGHRIITYRIFYLYKFKVIRLNLNLDGIDISILRDEIKRQLGLIHTDEYMLRDKYNMRATSYLLDLERFYMTDKNMKEFYKSKNMDTIRKYIYFNYFHNESNNNIIFQDIINIIIKACDNLINKKLTKIQVKESLLKTLDKISFGKFNDEYVRNENFFDSVYCVNKICAKNTSLIATIMGMINNYLFIEDDEKRKKYKELIFTNQ